MSWERKLKYTYFFLASSPITLFCHHAVPNSLSIQFHSLQNFFNLEIICFTFFFQKLQRGLLSQSYQTYYFISKLCSLSLQLKQRTPKEDTSAHFHIQEFLMPGSKWEDQIPVVILSIVSVVQNPTNNQEEDTVSHLPHFLLKLNNLIF